MQDKIKKWFSRALTFFKLFFATIGAIIIMELVLFMVDENNVIKRKIEIGITSLAGVFLFITIIFLFIATLFMIIWLLKTYKWKMVLLLIIGGLCIFGWLWIKMKFNKRETMEVADVIFQSFLGMVVLINICYSIINMFVEIKETDDEDVQE